MYLVLGTLKLRMQKTNNNYVLIDINNLKLEKGLFSITYIQLKRVIMIKSHSRQICQWRSCLLFLSFSLSLDHM